ncbi:MAG TPA: hypothetical protein VFS00_22945 [Polyangiaceae bacterium]|nr:hypothetical protein [Polyangiaceae bacterium]
MPVASTGRAPAARASAVRPRGVPSAAPVPKEERELPEQEPSEDAQRALLRRRLEAKASAGRASREELRSLMSLCLRQQDAACVAQAQARIGALAEEP